MRVEPLLATPRPPGILRGPRPVDASPSVGRGPCADGLPLSRCRPPLPFLPPCFGSYWGVCDFDGPLDDGIQPASDCLAELLPGPRRITLRVSGAARGRRGKTVDLSRCESGRPPL